MSDSQLRDQVLEACHGLAAYGLGSGIGGHVSVRVPGEELYWTNVLDRTFEEMQASDIVLIDFDGKVVESNRPISPGIGFHPGIYRLRADVGSVVHSHGFWITAQSAYARPLRNLHNLATYFHGRTAIAPDDEIDAIAPAMKADDIAIIIPWHGVITMGRDVGEAAALHVTFDYAARLDCEIRDSAPEMPEDHARGIQKLLKRASYLELTWGLMQRKAKRAMQGQTISKLPTQ